MNLRRSDENRYIYSPREDVFGKTVLPKIIFEFKRHPEDKLENKNRFHNEC